MTALGSLFSGYGGLDLAAEDVLDARTVWTCDVDPGASRILAARFPDAPNLGDITRQDWATVPAVDILTGGFPCQDVSHAGARAGLVPGTRTGLWARMADAIDHIRPSLVIAENVRGLLSAAAASDLEPCPWCMGGTVDGEPALRALGSVLADLADLGYDAAWHGLRAADVGAPHGRFRVFVLAWPADTASARGEVEPASDGGRAAVDGTEPRAGTRTRDGHPAEGIRVVGRGPRLVGESADDADARRERLARPEPDTTGRQGPTDDARGQRHAASDAGSEAVGLRAGLRTDEPRGIGRGRPHDHRSSAPTPDPDQSGRERPESARGRHVPARGTVPDAASDGRDERRPESTRQLRGPHAAVSGAATADPDGDGFEGVGRVDTVGCDADRRDRSGVAWGAYEPAIRRWERVLDRPAPAPTEPGKSGGQRLSPRFVEWMMGLPDGWVTDVPALSRNDQLRALGNGVVPQQAAAALRTLLAWKAAVNADALFDLNATDYTTWPL